MKFVPEAMLREMPIFRIDPENFVEDFAAIF